MSATVKPLPKFVSLQGENWVAHEYPRIYSIEHLKNGSARLCIAASQKGTELVSQLSERLSEPFFALYILLVGRGGSKEGRYQSPQMNRSDVNNFFESYFKFFDEDARHHVWLYSTTDKATLIYDQHNVIYAYGPIDEYQKILDRMGYDKFELIKFPVPHGHRYHLEFDEKEREITASENWIYSPLREGDDY